MSTMNPTVNEQLLEMDISSEELRTPARRYSPEQKLMEAILEETLREIQAYRRNRWCINLRPRILEIRSWLHGTSDAYLFSFPSIAHHLGLPENSVRTQLLRLTG